MTNRVLTRPRVAQREGIRRLRDDPPNCLGRLLLAELAQRTLNDLTIAIGIVQLAAWHCPASEEKSALSQSGTRLENLAKLQQVLLPPNHDKPIDVGPYIEVLCEAIAQSQLNHRKIELLRHWRDSTELDSMLADGNDHYGTHCKLRTPRVRAQSWHNILGHLTGWPAHQMYSAGRRRWRR
jgi:hypothetical protein